MATVIDFPSPVLLSDPEQIPTQAAFIVGYFLREYERLRPLGDSEALRQAAKMVRNTADLVSPPLFQPLRRLFIEAMNDERGEH